MTFEELEFKPRGSLGDGVQAKVKFANGYEASVICGPYTYGGDVGLYELAVMHGDRLVYDTPITDDVLGNLTPDDVITVLSEIEALPERKKA